MKMMQEGGRSSRQGARSPSPSPSTERNQASEESPSYAQLVAENGELKKRLQQERGMRQLYAKKLEDAEEEWLEQVEQLQAYVKSIRYSMVDTQNHPIASATRGEIAACSSDSQLARGSPLANSQSRWEKRQQVVRDLKGAFEAKKHVLEDDVAFIREVKEGVSLAPEMDPEHELQELGKKFRMWKHDFKEKLKSTAELLKRINRDTPVSQGRVSRGTVQSSQRGRSPGSPSSLDTTETDPDGVERKKEMDRRRAGFVRRFLSLGRSSQ